MTQVLPPWLQPLGRPLAPLYERIIRARNRRFDTGRGVERIDRPVISIGNITVGGTGKTPMVAWIAEQLECAGHRPCIAMRGYGAGPGERSDEEMEYADRLPSVPVIADPDRVAALRRQLPTMPEIDCVLLDDGYQHRRLHRDLDLVLIDATRDTFSDRMLPAGSLREPLIDLSRADAVILTRIDAVTKQDRQALIQHVERWHGRPPLAECSHQWRGLVAYDASGVRSEPLTWLQGRSITTLLGVGNPKAIEQQLQSAGARIMASIPAGDHERYDRAKLLAGKMFIEATEALVMTAKDWVKVRRLINLAEWKSPIIVPELELKFVQGREELMNRVLNAVPGVPVPESQSNSQ